MALRRTTSQMRSVMYEDIRKLLRPGFLSHPVTINGCRMAIRTLSQDDLLLLEYRAPDQFSSEWQAWSLAAAIWIIDGQVTIGDPNVQHMLYEQVKSLPRMAREDLTSVFSSLMGRVSHSVERLESFLYEDESRFLWRTEGMELLKRPPFMGAPVLGMNTIQKTWVSYNRYEDKRGERKYWWGLSKFMVQAHAPKGIQKLNNSERTEDEREEQRRQRVQDITYWKYRGFKIDEQQQKELLRDPDAVVQAETVEDLQKEMADWVAGRKDGHDNIVDFVKAKIRKSIEGRRQAEKDRIEAIREQLEEDDTGMDGSSFIPLVGQAAEAAQRKLMTPKSAPKVYEDDMKMHTAYEKYIAKNPEVGTLSVDEEGKIVVQAPKNLDHNALLELLTPPPEPSAENENQSSDLTNQVSQRASQQRGEKK